MEDSPGARTASRDDETSDRMSLSGPVVNGAPQCQATSKRTHQRCGDVAMQGTTVCWKHGGAAGQVRRKAAERMERLRLEGEVGALLEEIGVEAAHPVEVLLDVVHQAHSMATLCGHLVAGLSPHPTNDEGKAVEALYGPDHLDDARPHVLVELHRKWLDTAARSSKLAIEAGVAERQIRLAEAQAGQLAGVLRGVTGDVFSALVEAGVDAAVVASFQRDQLPGIMRRRMLEVAESSRDDAVDAPSEEVVRAG